MKVALIIIFPALSLLSGCIEMGYTPNYIISDISPEEKALVLPDEDP